ncbi:MAG: hypothetical protein AAF221_05085 [Pseudomonadota bacterium]
MFETNQPTTPTNPLSYHDEGMRRRSIRRSRRAARTIHRSHIA